MLLFAILGGVPFASVKRYYLTAIVPWICLVHQQPISDVARLSFIRRLLGSGGILLEASALSLNGCMTQELPFASSVALIPA